MRESHRSDLNRRPLDYESRALPLSYGGWNGGMPWPGFEPGRLAALPPQDSVSTSFTTRACRLPVGEGNLPGAQGRVKHATGRRSPWRNTLSPATTRTHATTERPGR